MGLVRLEAMSGRMSSGDAGIFSSSSRFIIIISIIIIVINAAARLQQLLTSDFILSSFFVIRHNITTSIFADIWHYAGSLHLHPVV